MTVSDYEELAGVSVATSKRRFMEANLERSQRILEGMLGYTLDPDLVEENLYTELGKNSSLNCLCSSINVENLDDPDEVEGAYRLFPYNPDDKFLGIDPASTIYTVKLVYVIGGPAPNGVTVKTFDTDDYRVEYGRDGWTKWLEISDCPCRNLCWEEKNVQLAVDADWLWPDDDMPPDLQFIWADMATYYGDTKRDLKSQTIGQHSWTKFDDTAPESADKNLKILKRYAGPHGTLSEMPV